MKRASVSELAILTILALTIAGTVSAQSPQPAMLGPVHKVKTGMDPNQVGGIMGRPEKIMTFLGVDEWCYCGPRGQVVVLYFDAGRVRDKVDFTDDGGNGEVCPRKSAGDRLDGRVPARVRDLWYSRAPRLILVTVSSGEPPVMLRDWNQNGNLLLAATPITSPPNLQGRPFYSVALFWGGGVASMDPTAKPKDANQHARFYPPTDSAPPLFVFDDSPGRWGTEARRVGLTRVLGQTGLEILAKAGVPIR